MKDRKIIAILRSINKKEIITVAEILINCGINKIEVTLNSPEAFLSLKMLADNFHDTATIGAGTVTKPEEVGELAKINQLKFIVTPNCNINVIKAAKKNKLQIYCGVFTPTECYTAIEAGTDALKIFPANMMGACGFSSLKQILPPDMPSYAVGSIGSGSFVDWLKVGITGFGIGSIIYNPNKSMRDIHESTKEIVYQYDDAISNLNIKA